MAKFNNKHLKLKDDQRAYFGTSDDASLWFDGSEMRSSTTISGVTPTQDYHLATKWYVDSEILSASLSGIDTSNFVLTDGTRAFTGTVSGISPTLDAHLATKGYIDTSITTLSGELGDYVLVDGTRGFTGTVSGIDPTQDYHLATKNYVDAQTDGNHKSGRTTLALNDASKAVTFAQAYGDTNYSISVIMSNTVDAVPSIYPTIISAKATTGFTVLFSGDIDSNNYVLEWIAKHD